MNLLQLPKCLLGNHREDRNRARPHGNTYRSVCIGCGIGMVRDLDGWKVVPKN